MINIDSLPIGYHDVVFLLGVHGHYIDEGLELSEDGIYVKKPAPEATAEEAAILSWHPTGNLSDPALKFPAKVSSFADFLDHCGLNGALEPFRFARWAVEKQFETLAGRGHLAAGGGNWRWPWGAHETNYLRNFAEVAQKFWGNYDPSDYTTGPKNEDVERALVSRGVPQRMAEIMATMLRADGLRTGPRSTVKSPSDS